MNVPRQSISFRSLDQELRGVLFLPQASNPVPAVLLCHGAGEFKENYFDLAERLAENGVASFAFDFHGHGESGGERFNVKMSQWVPDVQAAVGVLMQHPRIDSRRIGAFGLSSGGTAILETAAIDPRLKTLVALDATIRNSLPLPLSMFMKSLVALGHLKKIFTGSDLRLPLAKLSGGIQLCSDPEVDARIQNDPRAQEVYGAFPLPGGAEAFFVDTIERVAAINAPTLVIWGEEDKLDPVETGRMLHAALTCKKRIEVIAGNGHAGHLDRHREQVFALTTQWVLQNLGTGWPATDAAAAHTNGIPDHRDTRSTAPVSGREVDAVLSPS